MNTPLGVSVTLWYDYMRDDLVLRRHAESMYKLQKTHRSQCVLLSALRDIDRRLADDIFLLGGMAAQW